MGWFKKDVPAKGAVLFRGTMPPRAEYFAFLQKQGVTVKRKEAPDGLHWALSLRHEQWGKATLFCPRDMPAPPGEWIGFDARLSAAEKEEAAQGRSTVCLLVEPKHGNVLRDRKSLLRYLRAVMADDGVAALDHLAMRFWSRDALDDELSHDADLDIDALYTLHVIGDDAGERAIWLHTHGLAEIGHFDFDILEPSEDLFMGAADAIRAIAFAIVEGHVGRTTNAWELSQPGGKVRFVDVPDFMRNADSRFAEMRAGAEADHTDKRSVICEPVGLLGKFFGGGKPVPSKFLSQAFEEGIVNFSNAASDLSAERARGTYSMFRRLAEELKEFEFPVIAKVGYDVDGATDAYQREHLWFEVHALHDDHIDGTLQNTPFHIAAMKQGQRGDHPIERLSDWTIITPAGMINPRNTAPARMIREKRGELLKMMREERGEAGADDKAPIPLEG